MRSHLDANAGRELLDELGFLLVPGAPTAGGPAYLFVALRGAPTLRHFDPERIDCWVTTDGHGVPLTIERATIEADVGEHSWGTIHVVDRLGVANDFITFGGQLEVHRMADLKICVFSSESPIVARGGHSQEWEPGSQEMAGFLARLRAAADPRDSVERRLAQMSPVARYAAFVADDLARIRATEERVGWTRAYRTTLERERRRLAADAPADWEVGIEFAHTLAGAPVG